MAEWVKQAKIDQGHGPAGSLTSSERQELTQLKKEAGESRMERDFLTKCATCLRGRAHQVCSKINSRSTLPGRVDVSLPPRVFVRLLRVA